MVETDDLGKVPGLLGLDTTPVWYRIGAMADIRIESVQSPFDDPDIARLGISVVMRADAMGLLAERSIHSLDLAEWKRVANDVARAGVGKGIFADHLGAVAPDSNRFQAMLEHVNDALDASPVPMSEWPALQRVLGVDLLARLLCISAASVRRYLSGARKTPDHVAARLHALALMVGDLAGAYNDTGIRRWFARPRTVLGNRAPLDILKLGWRPDDPGPRQVRGLASALAASPAT